MFKEFRDFILKGNMLDLAIGVIIGAAFGKVVTEFTGVILAIIAKATGNTEVKGIAIGGIALDPLLNSLISLVIVGFALFIVVKAYNTAKRLTEKPAPKEEVAATVPADVQLLSEIRDLLKSKP
jgi:large conductance mechanosensitive channel